MATTRPDSVTHEPETAFGRPEPPSVPLRDPKSREHRREDPPVRKPDQVDPPATRDPREPGAPGDPETEPPDPGDPMRSGT